VIADHGNEFKRVDLITAKSVREEISDNKLSALVQRIFVRCFFRYEPNSDMLKVYNDWVVALLVSFKAKKIEIKNNHLFYEEAYLNAKHITEDGIRLDGLPKRPVTERWEDSEIIEAVAAYNQRMERPWPDIDLTD